MSDKFPVKTKKPQTETRPATGNLFMVGVSYPMNNIKLGCFHTTVDNLFSDAKKKDWTFIPLFLFYSLE